VENIQVERIAGLTNTNYRVDVNGERFVLRVSGENTVHLGINRQQEFTALKNAAVIGLGPEVFAFLLPEGHLVTHWVVEAYIQTAYHYSVPFPVNFERFIETMRAIEAEQQRDPSGWWHFCHNDLV
jgi:thiamine kinase-like enzyme